MKYFNETNQDFLRAIEEEEVKTLFKFIKKASLIKSVNIELANAETAREVEEAEEEIQDLIHDSIDIDKAEVLKGIEKLVNILGL